MRRSLLIQGAMGSLGVVILPPCFNDVACEGKTGYPMDVEARVAERAVEALQIPVLRGFAGLDEVKGDLLHVGPGVEDLARKLWTPAR